MIKVSNYGYLSNSFMHENTTVHKQLPSTQLLCIIIEDLLLKMKIVVLVIFLVSLCAITTVSALSCNGMQGLCDLTLDKVTFPGAHNAGAGFNGNLHFDGWWGTSPVADSCFYKNVNKNFYSMLDNGVRFFDIDTCLYGNQLESCHNGVLGVAYGGALKIAFDQIDRYMKSHPNEVIILHFNRDVTGSHSKISKKIITELEKRWDPNVASNQVKMNTERPRWPTLRQAIETNQRIFIFMHHGLAIEDTANRKNYIYKTDFSSYGNYQSTYDSGASVGPGGCDGIIEPASRLCDTDTDFVELSAFGRIGLCVWDMAWHCSNSLPRAADECYKQRKKHSGKTVNIILVDYPVSNSGSQSVMKRARILNERNIQRFSGK
jgi:hypothetical protein